MITKIGVIYQDRNSIGFLRGLRDRLKCDAEFVEPPARVGKPRILPRQRAKFAWLYFRKQGVDLVVRFTDADRDRWQEVRREELERVPPEARAMWICGVAVNNPEEWLCLHVHHLAAILEVPPDQLDDPAARTGVVKRALAALTRTDAGQSDVVARIVRNAPCEVFRRWLEDDALRKFYSDCRAAAARAECETPNELDVADDE